MKCCVLLIFKIATKSASKLIIIVETTTSQHMALQDMILENRIEDWYIQDISHRLERLFLLDFEKKTRIALPKRIKISNPCIDSCATRGHSAGIHTNLKESPINSGLRKQNARFLQALKRKADGVSKQPVHVCMCLKKAGQRVTCDYPYARRQQTCSGQYSPPKQ